MIHQKSRGFAYGIFNTLYGFGLMVSGIFVGYFYSSLTIIIAVVIALQIGVVHDAHRLVHEKP